MSAIASASSRLRLRALTWNLAAINNNPFEYWVSHDDDAYNDLMSAAAEYVKNGSNAETDASPLIHEIFTDEMFGDLKTEMEKFGWQKEHVDATEEQWVSNLRNRKAVSGFLKDSELGAKRLISMPDRTTNTFGAHCRPTVINCYEGGDLSSIGSWWAQWRSFLFSDPVMAAARLVPVKRAKYPAVTEHEETISLPLQTLCLAIFDAVMVNMMNSLAPGTWQTLRKDISGALNKNKWTRTTEIMQQSYGDYEIMFLQEVSSKFIDELGESPFSTSHHIVAPSKLGKRDQNSIILLSKSAFPDAAAVKELQPLAAIKGVGDGDLVVTSAQDCRGESWILASFHGDTNGLCSNPTVAAVHELTQAEGQKAGGNLPRLLFGLDANTHRNHKEGKVQGVDEFAAECVALGLTSCWGDAGAGKEEYTTYNARTYLQTQLHKACSRDAFMVKGDVNPKDSILYYKDPAAGGFFGHESTSKDNTGNTAREFVPDTPFPSMQFPSDHAVLSTTMLVSSKNDAKGSSNI